MSIVKINWHPDKKELRKFGIVVTIGLVLVGLLAQFAFNNPTGAWAAYIGAALLGLPALTGTAVALPGYRLWMGIAFVMGNILNRVLLTLIYFFLFTPLGWVRRACRKDPLQLCRPNTNSYWRNAPPVGTTPKDYERLF